jgi:nucleoside diphosphate kinase
LLASPDGNAVDTKKTSNQTFAIIKPDAYPKAKEVIDTIKDNGFKIVRQRDIQLTKEHAGLFYKEHEGKPFYETLVTWMSR